MPTKKQLESLDNHLYMFHEGNDIRAYDFLGAHFGTEKRKKGVRFRVWAPEAQAVSVIGDFNEWSHDTTPMTKISVGVWEAFVPGLQVYDNYKYAVQTQTGEWRRKADPYAFHAETRPDTASKIYDLGGYTWGDAAWQKAKTACYNAPMNIYEMNPGSWRYHEDGNLMSYRDMIDVLVPYVKEMGYTHVELMPVTEYPYDGSWGYQVTGYFAATSRFGTPHDFMALVDAFHQAGIGVILDWVPAHFPKDAHGLAEFDGSYCYEYSDPLKREHEDWGTLVFDYGRNEVRSFLLSSALFWLEKFHIDGLRVDAVASMLYLDYSRSNKAWRRNIYGGNENLEAIDFIKKLNEQIFANFPHALMIAEESTAFPMVTKPVHMGGLGFNYKWNMGWMHDSLEYFGLNPFFRQHHHNNLTFAMLYAFSENFILPLSHDEVVHGKGSMIGRMPGAYEEKFAGLRAYYAFMLAHPGKKLTFMGHEIAQFDEWDENKQIQWQLLDYPAHAAHHAYVRAMNNFYLSRPEMWEIDTDWEGFEWLCNDDAHGNTLAFLRRDEDGKELICVFNFNGEHKSKYKVGVPREGEYAELFNSDAAAYGGGGVVNGTVTSKDEPWQGRNQSMEIELPAYGAVFLARK
ncbi:MAG: 1,4-alpha-glucan branching protein GlgB [Oscillospiraceae bacterium]|nr:1,4-alpha-glucan branching protein GlgB [Oscillospiraceae bacterium]